MVSWFVFRCVEFETENVSILHDGLPDLLLVFPSSLDCVLHWSQRTSSPQPWWNLLKVSVDLSLLLPVLTVHVRTSPGPAVKKYFSCRLYYFGLITLCLVLLTVLNSLFLVRVKRFSLDTVNIRFCCLTQGLKNVSRNLPLTWQSDAAGARGRSDVLHLHSHSVGVESATPTVPADPLLALTLGQSFCRCG